LYARSEGQLDSALTALDLAYSNLIKAKRKNAAATAAAAATDAAAAAIAPAAIAPAAAAAATDAASAAVAPAAAIAAAPAAAIAAAPAVAVAAVNDNYQDDEDFAATLDEANINRQPFRVPTLRPREPEGCLPLVRSGNIEMPSDYIRTFDPKAWFVPELPVSDWGVQTSNQVEALGSAFMRGGARSCNPTESLQIIMFSILSFFGHVRSRLHELKRRGELFLPAWPGHDKDHEHDSDVVDGYSLDVIEERIRYKVSRDGKYHVVMTPPPAQFEATARKEPFLPPHTTDWRRPLHGWRCDGSCLIPQREGYLCRHAKRVLRDLPTSQRKMATLMGVACYYNVQYLLNLLSRITIEFLQHSEVARGPTLLPIHNIPALRVSWVKDNGGGQEHDDKRKESAGEQQPRKKRQPSCSDCGQQGHYKGNCLR
jgi:hypothetical protein